MVRPTYQYYKKYLKIKSWKNQFHIDAHELVFEKLYQHVNGYRLSKQARTLQDAPEYTYGEIEFESFLALLSLIKPTEETTFYDLGCGTGKAVIAASMVYDLKKAVGVELFEGLYLKAVQQQKKLAKISGYQGKAERIQWIHANFLDVNFSDATLIFINSTAFSPETWQILERHLAQTAIGSTIMTMSKKLISPEFVIIHQTSMNMSWGPATVYIHVHQGFGSEWSYPTQRY